MRVRFAKATGCPYGQFVIEAESDEDEAMMACFLSAPRSEWTLWHHGTTYGHRSPGSFNFGWIETAWLEKSRSDRRWYARFLAWLKDLAKYEIHFEVKKRCD